MCDITKQNFEARFEEIEQNIRAAAFIAVDCEFTSLTAGGEQSEKNSLFDSGEERYKKLRLSASRGIINQVGLSVFHFDDESYRYTSFTYNFYIRPRPFASLDPEFVCQASSLEFLTRYNFDFNKFIYDGISYLNSADEARLKGDLDSGALFRGTERNISFRDEDHIREKCSQVAEWMQEKSPGSELIIDCGHVPSYVMHHEIRGNFSNLWSTPGQTDQSIQVKVVSPEERTALQEGSEDLSEALLTSYRGFSRVMQVLKEAKKPLVGHNCYMDLLKIQHQFLSPLPASYEQFKREMKGLCPLIFDTKHISFSVRKELEADESLMALPLISTNLGDMYKNLTIRLNDLMYTPKIDHAPGFDRYEEIDCPHEAGYDAYMTGYCFIKIAHIASTLNYLTPGNMKRLNFREHLQSVHHYANQLNLGRAAITHLNLSGPDPTSNRPQWLLVSARGKFRKLHPISIAERLSRYGSVDVKPHSSNQLLVAISNHRSAKDILAAFRTDKEYRVVQYNALRHSKTLRRFIMVGLSSMTAFGVITALTVLRKK